MKAEVGKRYRNIHTNKIYTVKEIRITPGVTVIVTDGGNWASPLFQDCFRDDVQDAAAVSAAGVMKGANRETE
jgi:hypothetical protein